MYKRSIEDPSGFWGDIAKQFHWEKPWDPSAVVKSNFDVRKGPIVTEWFKGGKTNVAYNCLDQHVAAGRGDHKALLWEGNEPTEQAAYTFSELKDLVCQISNYLREVGAKKGDRVVIYLPMRVELPAAMLACARIGAVHSVVFGGFSAEALAQRIVDSQPVAVITMTAVMRGAKPIGLKNIVDDALKLAAKEGYQAPTVVVVDNPVAAKRESVAMTAGRDVWWHDSIPRQAKEAAVEWVDAEDPLFMLYTSGSTGKPKGVLHTTGGYMIYTATTFKYVFDYKENDVYWCTADCGWITGHSYLTYGPLLNGATNVIFEGVPTYPDAGRCWEIVDKYKVSLFYTAPTAIRSLERLGNEWVTKHSRASLRVLGSVGEPINPEAWRWYNTVVGEGRCPIVDTWWQTETGGHMITSLPGAIDAKPGSATLPFFGVEPVILDDKGNELSGAAEGVLCIKSAWPSVLRTIYGDQARFEQAYFGAYKGYFFTSDGARRDKDGYYWITGRVDDVVNVSGHRIGTAEVESALVLHEMCVEAAVVGVDHPIKGQGIYAYVTLMEGVAPSDELRKALTVSVRNQIGAFAAPDVIHWAQGLPKTRSGKIMRRILRKIAAKEDDGLGDISTLADPAVVEDLIATRGK
jgi:acetyl-CoA synthetase